MDEKCTSGLWGVAADAMVLGIVGFTWGGWVTKQRRAGDDAASSAHRDSASPFADPTQSPPPQTSRPSSRQ